MGDVQTKKEVIKKLILPNRQHRQELRNKPDFAVPIVKSVCKGLESLSYLGQKIWKLLPLDSVVNKGILYGRSKNKIATSLTFSCCDSKN